MNVERRRTHCGKADCDDPYGPHIHTRPDPLPGVQWIGRGDHDIADNAGEQAGLSDRMVLRIASWVIALMAAVASVALLILYGVVAVCIYLLGTTQGIIQLIKSTEDK
jgi:hypothetical protein